MRRGRLDDAIFARSGAGMTRCSVFRFACRRDASKDGSPMNIRIPLVSAFTALMLSGCGQKSPATTSESSSSSTPSASSSTAATTTATAPAGAARTVEITANDQMKYSINSIEAKPGEELRVELTNTGALPKQAMAHNWVLLKAGSDAAAFSAAAAASPTTGYIPDSLKDEIIAKIDLQGPHETGEVTFKAPTQPGDYPFLCSFPAHYAVGMKGTLTVK